MGVATVQLHLQADTLGAIATKCSKIAVYVRTLFSDAG